MSLSLDPFSERGKREILSWSSLFPRLRAAQLTIDSRQAGDPPSRPRGAPPPSMSACFSTFCFRSSVIRVLSVAPPLRTQGPAVGVLDSHLFVVSQNWRLALLEQEGEGRTTAPASKTFGALPNGRPSERPEPHPSLTSISCLALIFPLPLSASDSQSHPFRLVRVMNYNTTRRENTERARAVCVCFVVWKGYSSMLTERAKQSRTLTG